MSRPYFDTAARRRIAAATAPRRVPGDTKITLNFFVERETDKAFATFGLGTWFPKSQVTAVKTPIPGITAGGDDADSIIDEFTLNIMGKHVGGRKVACTHYAITMPVWLLRSKDMCVESFIEKHCIEQGTWAPPALAA